MTWNLKRLGRRQTSWNLRYSPRSSDISFSIKGNQTVTRPAFSPEAYSALEESYVMCLKWSVWILTFRQARSLRWNRKKAACFTPYSIIFAAMCVRDVWCKIQVTKAKSGKTPQVRQERVLRVPAGSIWGLRRKWELRELVWQWCLHGSNSGMVSSTRDQSIHRTA